jgi:hypothetical protein
MKNIDLAFCFKGARQYIHGTDMLNQCTALLREKLGGGLEQLDFVIHRMTDRNLCLSLYPAESVPDFDALEVAGLKFAVAGKYWDARLSDADDSPDCRYPYDEDVVVHLSSLDAVGRQIVLQQEAPYSEIETLVAMTKALHQKVFPELDGSWVFCRWSSPRWPLAENLRGVCIKLTQTLGTRLTRSEVSLDGKMLGHIYFSARSSK